MDRLDLGILREMSRQRVLWWGSLDPRLCAEDLARRLKVDPTTVRARLAAWRKAGFLLGTEVVPNPRLFGARLGGGSVRVDDPRRKEQVFRDLALVDGLLVVADNVGPWIAIHLADEGRGSLARREELLRRLAGIDEVAPCIAHDAPPCSAKPTALDWRILQALRASPSQPLRVAAARVGISSKTFARRYGALADAGAVWSVPLLDFSRWSGGVIVRLLGEVAPDADPRKAAEAARRAFPDLVDLATPSELGLGMPYRIVDVVLHLDAAGAVEDAEKALLDVPGVTSVEALFPRRFHVYPHWFDERIAEALARAG